VRVLAPQRHLDADRVALADPELGDGALRGGPYRLLVRDLLDDLLGVGERLTALPDAHVDDDLLEVRLAHLVGRALGFTHPNPPRRRRRQ
jgi:hypothetical protein